VLWREWHRNRPSKLGRRLWAALLIICWSIVAWGTYELIAGLEQLGSRSIDAGYGILLWLTIKTFDRCVGRMPESCSPVPLPALAVSTEPALAVMS
jgi:hypothetical protein